MAKKPAILRNDAVRTGTKVLRCKCDNEFQDRQYGGKGVTGMRVHNGCKGGYRCSNCKKLNYGG